MEARIVQLPTNEIRVEGDRIVIERFVVRDPTLAAVLAQQIGRASCRERV